MPAPVMVQDTAIVAEGLGHLLAQFSEKPRIQALLTSYLAQCQLIENMFFDLLSLRTLDNPLTAGVQLDVIGRIVGQAREGLTDSVYESFLKARILANKSDGRNETLIAITALILGVTAGVKLRELYPKAVEIEADNVTANAYTLFHEFLQVAKDAGTNISLVFSKSAASATLKLTTAATSTLTMTTAQRFGSIYTGGIGGGVIAGYFGGDTI